MKLANARFYQNRLGGVNNRTSAEKLPPF